MSNVDTLVLSSGGIKSLIAAASLGRSGVGMLFVHDGRPATARRKAKFLEQAEYLGAARRIELAMTHLTAVVEEMVRRTPLHRLQLLNAAMGQAARLGADRLVWPVCVGEDFDAVGKVAELLVLVEHAASVEGGRGIRIETPLLEFTPAQLIEAGEQMSLPWAMTRSCEAADEQPCGACIGCRQRADAFAAVGTADPALATR